MLANGLVSPSCIHYSNGIVFITGRTWLQSTSSSIYSINFVDSFITSGDRPQFLSFNNTFTRYLPLNTVNSSNLVGNYPNLHFFPTTYGTFGYLDSNYPDTPFGRCYYSPVVKAFFAHTYR